MVWDESILIINHADKRLDKYHDFTQLSDMLKKFNKKKYILTKTTTHYLFNVFAFFFKWREPQWKDMCGSGALQTHGLRDLEDQSQAALIVRLITSIKVSVVSLRANICCTPATVSWARWCLVKTEQGNEQKQYLLQVKILLWDTDPRRDSSNYSLWLRMFILFSHRKTRCFLVVFQNWSETQRSSLPANVYSSFLTWHVHSTSQNCRYSRNMRRKLIKARAHIPPSKSSSSRWVWMEI